MGISRISKNSILIWAVANMISFENLASAQEGGDQITYIKSIMIKVRDHKETVKADVKEPKVELLAPGTFKIAQILPRNPPVVIIDGGKKQGIVADSILDSFRTAPPPVPDGERVPVTTGRLKVIHVDEDYAMATVIRDGGLIANAFFPEHPGTMAGDLVMTAKQTIAKRQSLTPQVDMKYADLFIDPKAFPTTFELTEEGRDLLRAEAEKFKDLHVPALLVEAYTDKEGASDTNQVESYERALTIRQFLINELGFAPSRVVAIGMGESSQLDSNHVSGYQQRNRRVVLKVNMHVPRSH